MEIVNTADDILAFARKKKNGQFTAREIESLYNGAVKDCYLLVDCGKLKLVDAGKRGFNSKPAVFSLP